MFCVWVVYLYNPWFGIGPFPFQSNRVVVCFLALKMPWETLGLGKRPDFLLGGRTIHDFFVRILPHLFWVMKNNKIRVGLVGIEGLWIGYGESICWWYILGSIISLEKPSKLSIEHIYDTLPSFQFSDMFSSHFFRFLFTAARPLGSLHFVQIPYRTPQNNAVESSTDTSVPLSVNHGGKFLGKLRFPE